MRRLNQILLILILTLGGLFSLSFFEKESVFTAEEAASYSTLGNKVICPVMGGAFNITEKSEKSEYHGKVYYFCCPGCKAPFKKSPEKYLKEEEKEY